MDPESGGKVDSFKKKYTNFFWWTPPIGFVADLIAILSLFNFKQNLPQPVSSNPSTFDPSIFGRFALSDAIFLTGWFTAFVIATVIYAGFQIRKKTKDFSLIVSGFLSLLLIYLYFHLWLGENWWVFLCIAPIFIIGLVLLGGIAGATQLSVPRTIPNFTDNKNATPNNQPDKGQIKLDFKSKPNIQENQKSTEYWPDIWGETKRSLNKDWESTKKELFDWEKVKEDFSWEKAKKDAGITKDSFMKGLLGDETWERMQQKSDADKQEKKPK